MTIFGFRPAFWPTVITVPALALLIALGTWQSQRLFWKLDLIASIERGMAADPVPLPAGELNPADWNYRRVTLRGAFDYSREFHMLAHSERGNFGYHIIVPFKRSDAPGYVLVNRGWVPPEHKQPQTRAEGQVPGEVILTGIAKAPWPKGYFIPDHDAKGNLWYHGDAAGMLAEAGIKDAPLLFVDADAAPANPGGWPRGGQTRLTLPNNHLAYAFTWYSAAVVLAVIYVLWHRRRQQGAV